jgi:hypothetical protein
MLLVVLGNRLFGSLPFTPLSTTLRPRPPLVNNFGSPITKIRVGCTGTGDVCGPDRVGENHPPVRPPPPRVERDGQPLGRLRVESRDGGQGPHPMAVLRPGSRPRTLGSTSTAVSNEMSRRQCLDEGGHHRGPIDDSAVGRAHQVNHPRHRVGEAEPSRRPFGVGEVQDS